jgi:hypothetical protein
LKLFYFAFVAFLPCVHGFSISGESHLALYEKALANELAHIQWGRQNSFQNVLELTKVLADPELDNLELLPPELIAVTDELKDSDFKEKLYKTHHAISLMKVDDEAKMEVIESIRANWLESCMEEMKWLSKKKAAGENIKVNASLKTRYDSNISQAPNNVTLVSKKSGFSGLMDVAMDLRLGAEQRWNLSSGVGMMHYFDNDPQISIRNSANQRLGLSYSNPWGGILGTFGYDLRADLTEGTGRLAYTFSTHTLGSTFVFPTQSWKMGYFENFVPIGKFDCGFLRFNGSAKDKNSICPALSFIGIGIKKKDELQDTGVMFLRVADQSSDAISQDYFLSMLDFSFERKTQAYTIKPNLGFQTQLQSEYQSFVGIEKRRDFKWNAGLELAKFLNANFKTSIGYGYERQSSSIDALEYDNHKFTISFSNR